MDPKRYFREMIDNHKTFGTGPTAQWFFLKTINRFVKTRVMVGMTLEHVEAAGLKIDPRFQVGLLKAADLYRFVGTPGWDDPSFGLSRDLLDRFERAGVEFFCITDADRLASIGCYARRTTLNGGQPVHFNPDYTYMFRGFTHPDYRGFRLHGVGMSLAMKEYQRQGLKGLISDVDGRNLSSLKSVYRLGYKKIGLMYMFEIFGKHFIFTDAGCKKYGFRYGQPAPKEVAPAAEVVAAGR